MAQAENKKMTVERILEISEAVAMVGENKYLDGVTTFKVGMLGDYVKPVVKSYIKQRDRLIQDSRRKIKLITDAAARDTGEASKIKMAQDIADINNSVQEKLDELSNEETEIKIPELKMSNFIAKGDVSDMFSGKDGSLDVKVMIKSGQSLVPVRFFMLMGDIVIDDKN